MNLLEFGKPYPFPRNATIAPICFLANSLQRQNSIFHFLK
ncbi:hypothetical protein M094_0218 [Bacteroides uniformis str. 3978 T3 ii]|uniref:Uncharacterized protein n=1 Tax=Bacteroides uniformis str. 3978 T3 ii TaxID=1339349 RepID=A0A078S690_BACUN|nr:hypothetical protein M094_0218 [Bacteroides uniformis str. 3978 T3 ii]